MKHIFVSIQEFLQNGGILAEGREFYSQQEKSHKGQYLYDLAGSYLRREADGVIIMQGLNASHPALPHVFYVKIEVTPIWK